MSYSDLLKDPRWQRKRLEIMQRDDFKCVSCGDDKTTLNVHHVHYVRGRRPWEYAPSELRTLCEPCHADEHGKGIREEREAAQRLAEQAERRQAEREQERMRQLREVNPHAWMLLYGIAEIEGRMRAATEEERNALILAKVSLRDALRESGYQEPWRSFR